MLRAETPLLLTIDDDTFFRAQVRQYAQPGFNVIECPSAAESRPEALSMATVIVLDLNMPDIDGVSFIKTLSRLRPQPGLIIASGYDRKIIELAQKTAALSGMHNTVILQKPVSRRQFRDALERIGRATLHDRPGCDTPVFDCSLYDIKIGMTEGEFLPYFQPQICLDTDRLAGLEVLARWNHPQAGLLAPGQFIEQLEVSELAMRFTLMVAGMALQEIEKWSDRIGFDGTLSVNIPPAVLAEDDFPDELNALLQRYDFPPARFICEITERGLENERGAATAASLTRLRMKGYQLAIDDFGIGQSGLVKLKSMAFDEIKVDREFVANMSAASETMAIVKSVRQLADEMGMRVVMEGIEDANTLELVRQFGGTIGQGYFLAKPMSAQCICEWISAWSSEKESHDTDRKI